MNTKLWFFIILCGSCFYHPEQRRGRSVYRLFVRKCWFLTSKHRRVSDKSALRNLPSICDTDYFLLKEEETQTLSGILKREQLFRAPYCHILKCHIYLPILYIKWFDHIQVAHCMRSPAGPGGRAGPGYCPVLFRLRPLDPWFYLMNQVTLSLSLRGTYRNQASPTTCRIWHAHLGSHFEPTFQVPNTGVVQLRHFFLRAR